MQLFLLLLFLFISGCFLGWCLEVFYRRFFAAKKWVNPGFMKGPWLPLYGFGLVLMFSICFLIVFFFPFDLYFYNPLGGFGAYYPSGPTWADLIPISLMWLSMVLLEFIAGLIFIKGFHIKLWDYSNMRGNIMGVICPLFNFFWLVIAVVFYYGINPFLYKATNIIYEFMFGEDGMFANVGFIFLMGIFYGIMIYDFVSSVGLFATVSKFAKASGIVEKYETIKDKWNSIKNEEKERFFSRKKKEEKPEQHRESFAKIKQKANEILYIDPNKKGTSENYDEHGRPVKMEDDKENK